MPGIPEAIQIALQHHQAGRLAQAEQIYHQILAAAPQHPDALHLLGVAAQQKGNLAAAADYMRRSILANGTNASCHRNLGGVYASLGQLQEAIGRFRTALQLTPHDATIQLGLAHLLRETGAHSEAISLFQSVLQASPQNVEAHHGLGLTLVRSERVQEAIGCYQRALQLSPGAVPILLSLANAYMVAGERGEAAKLFDLVWNAGPAPDPAMSLNLGYGLREFGKFHEAITCFQRTLELQPTNAEALRTLGLVWQELGQHAKAEECFLQLIRLRPQQAEPHCCLADTYRSRGAYDEAIRSYERAIQLNPRFAAAHRNLGHSYNSLGLNEESTAAFRRANEISPDPILRYYVATVLPIIPQSRDEIQSARQHFSDQVEEFIRDGVQFDPLKVELYTPFYLAYHGLNDRDIQSRVSQLFRTPSAAESGYVASVYQRGERIRVGFVSAFLRNHTIGRLNRGVISRLSRDQFGVSVFLVGSSQDEIANDLRRQVENFVELPLRLRDAARQIAEAKLHAIIYTDIGMEPMTYSLARVRLAPVQAVLWGHPVTTGIPTIDYFLSSELLEAPEAQEHYTEKLVRLPSLNTYYYRPTPPANKKNREAFGLPTEKNLYLCPQTLFKFHPDFDDALAAILRTDPLGEVVLLEGQQQRWTEQLCQRLQRSLGDVHSRVRFLPTQSYEDFLQLLLLADVMLDPFHFGGGNTTFEGLAMGTPIVTLPSPFLRGRITLACYRAMEMTECVAATPQEFVEIAVRLGTDRQYRQHVHAQILAKCGVLFENDNAVQEMERFLKSAVEGAKA